MVTLLLYDNSCIESKVTVILGKNEKRNIYVWCLRNHLAGYSMTSFVMLAWRYIDDKSVIVRQTITVFTLYPCPFFGLLNYWILFL